MSEPWTVVLLVGAAAIGMKAAGPVVVGGRQLPERALLLVGALAPALLGALVVTNTLASGRSLVLDERAVGLAAAALCIWLRAPLLVSVIAAAVATGLARSL